MGLRREPYILRIRILCLICVMVGSTLIRQLLVCQEHEFMKFIRVQRKKRRNLPHEIVFGRRDSVENEILLWNNK